MATRFNVHFHDGKLVTVTAETAAKAKQAALKVKPLGIFLYTSRVRSTKVTS